MAGHAKSPTVGYGLSRPPTRITRHSPLHLAPSPTPDPQTPAGEHVAPPRWLSVDQIRKQQRMRRETVLAAMLSGELPFEQRGRIRYARECDVRAWEEKRLKRGPATRLCEIHPDLLRYV